MNRTECLAPRWLTAVAAALINFVVVSTPLCYAQVPCGYEIAHVIQGPWSPPSDAPITVGRGISPNGQYVVGYYYGIGGSDRGFVYRTATSQFTTMPLPSGISSVAANEVNDAGLVVGHMGGVGGSFAFLFDIDSNQYLVQIPPAVNAGSSTFYGVNAYGIACGTRTISVNPTRDNAFIWSAKDGVLDLGVMSGPNSGATDINDQSDVCGWTGTQTNRLGFVYARGRVTIIGPVPGGTKCNPHALNNSRIVVGSGAGPIPFLWNEGFTILPYLNTQFDGCSAEAINDAGLIVGGCLNEGPGIPEKPVVWMNSIAIDLTTITTPATGVSIDVAGRIASTGTIVARGRLDPGDWNVAIVLEPRTPNVGDTNCDRIVGIQDLLHVITDWGPCLGCSTDLNGDQSVNIQDLLLVIANWG